MKLRNTKMYPIYARISNFENNGHGIALPYLNYSPSSSPLMRGNKCNFLLSSKADLFATQFRIFTRILFLRQEISRAKGH